MKTCSLATPAGITDLSRFGRKPETFFSRTEKRALLKHPKGEAYQAKTRDTLRELLDQPSASAWRATDAHGNTPLHYFAKWRRPELVEMLAGSMAFHGLNMKNLKGETPLARARTNGNLETARYLEQLHEDFTQLLALLDLTEHPPEGQASVSIRSETWRGCLSMLAAGAAQPGAAATPPCTPSGAGSTAEAVRLTRTPTGITVSTPGVAAQTVGLSATLANDLLSQLRNMGISERPQQPQDAKPGNPASTHKAPSGYYKA